MDHPPRLVLDEARPGMRLALDSEDIQHLVKVLRLSTGAALEVLDGRGRAYDATLELERRGATVAIGGVLREAPAPGMHGAILPRVEAWAPWPKGNRAADAVGRLAQLGVAAWQPLVTLHTESEARHDGEGRRQKLGKVAREALKQCGGLHALEVRPAIGMAEALLSTATSSAHEAQAELRPASTRQDGAPPSGQSAQLATCDFVLDPSAPQWLSTELRAMQRPADSEARPTCFRLWAGPEAGFNPAELDALRGMGFALVRVSELVLRIETALEAASAIVLEHAAARTRR